MHHGDRSHTPCPHFGGPELPFAEHLLAGQWVAWSPDGSFVAASAADPALLDSLLQAAGEDPLQCVIEGIPGDDALPMEVDGSAA